MCPIPVLLVKNRRLYHRPRVLAAVDPSHAFAKPSNLDRQILRAGAQLVHALRGELHALHVFHPGVPVIPAMPDGPMMDVAAERDLERAGAAQTRTGRRRIRREAQPLPPGGRTTERSDPGRRQARTQRHRRHGVVSRSGLKRFFIGNTAEFVMDAVTADILVVKPADFASRVPRTGRGVQILSMPILPG